jgi:hypothetical protein
VFSLLLVYILTLFVSPEAIPAVGPAVIIGIVGAAGLHQGANVADHVAKGKYYRPELDGK